MFQAIEIPKYLHHLLVFILKNNQKFISTSYHEKVFFSPWKYPIYTVEMPKTDNRFSTRRTLTNCVILKVFQKETTFLRTSNNFFQHISCCPIPSNNLYGKKSKKQKEILQQSIFRVTLFSFQIYQEN